MAISPPTGIVTFFAYKYITFARNGKPSRSLT